MKRILNFSVLIFIILSPLHSNCGSSLSLEYTLNGQTQNPWGDLNFGVNYVHSHNSPSTGKGTAKINLLYKNAPGLLGKWGHLEISMDIQHSDTAIHSSAQLITAQINTMCSYNPEIIRKLSQKLNQEKQYVNRQKIILQRSAEKNHLAKHEIQKKFFLEHKTALEMMPADIQGQDYAAIQDMIKQMQEKNDC
jgi:hypothetical protein